MLFLQELKIDPKVTAKKIEELVQKQVKSLGKEGVVIGLSGGLDSSVCACLCLRALGTNKILALILPEKDNNPLNMEHAKLVARNLGLRIKIIDLTKILDQVGVYQLFSDEERTNREKAESLIKHLTEVTKTPSIFAAAMSFVYSGRGDLRRRAERKLLLLYTKKLLALMIAKVRLRMLILYYWAALENYLVVGTTDKTEWTIGFYDKYGDGASDITLLRHLYKTQIRELARYLGVPQDIIQKPSSGDLVARLPNEVLIGLSYEQLDQILLGMEKKMSNQEIAQKIDISKESIEAVKSMVAFEKIRRGMPRSL